ncbi:Trans-2,3-dihydro-3-hydroxyanthranilate isomerase [Roseovarius albus]|uniref:Trans-2,3-dihydro-3-hydroxyanthranilate isomerase n=1 Tax=Roseovarius albus TaxID=1247867 RepID=A0A1X6YSV7_9RHOB|nr:PhzF family phenazine biosynthesis protein [Roseovarius albus]SLN28412.1 Trans-2,3-dihydro-3-hydroxyanthranilate isomerase [Roseovarius albus]
MPSYPVDWVDAFSDQPFGGNGCAVVHDGGVTDVETCLKFVRETSLVECTFVGPSDVADVMVRYFLASREIPFAGHPTIATVVSLLHRGVVSGGEFTMETGAGIVPIRVERSEDAMPLVFMTQVAPEFGPKIPIEEVARIGGIDPEDIVGQPQLVSTGLPFCITVVKDHEVLRRVKLDSAALVGMAERHGYSGTDMLEPFWVTLDGVAEAGDTFSRLLLAPPSPPEDPFTGSATGAMASYLWRNGMIQTPEFTAQQGHWLGRPGQAQVRVLGPSDAITGVEVAGQGWLLMSGDLHL